MVPRDTHDQARERLRPDRVPGDVPPLPLPQRSA